MSSDRTTAQTAGRAPLYCVWELTLKCDLACRHCGSRAGKARARELTRDEALDVVRQLAELGCREVTFIGGEAYLNPDWLHIVSATAAAGLRATMTTGGRALDARMAKAAADAGMTSIGLSIDGMEETHDRLRAVPGSFRAAVAAMGHVRDAGMRLHANSQLNRLNLGELPQLGQLMADNGVGTWQVQITGAMGRAADQPDWLLQPWQMLELVETLARIKEETGINLEAANNLGYYGPFEGVLRTHPWQGCSAGRYVLGIESNGDVKGCPSLPSAPYVGGNLRESSLAEIWQRKQLTFSVDRDERELWGHCGSCYYRSICRGGCSWTAHTLLGRRGNMPYCYHRADTLRSRGLRERLVRVEAAPGQPFDMGRYELVEEPDPTR